MEYKTINKRQITVMFSDSPVTRIRIKRNELVIRYSQSSSQERQDDIYDTVIALERNIDRDSPTVRVKILDTDSLDTIQCEIGNTDHQTKIIKHRGVDY